MLKNLRDIIYNFVIKYKTPRILNYTWNFGSLILFFFFIQVISGFLLTFYYTATIEGAFFSIHRTVVRDVNYGWLIHDIHVNGASFFFIFLYLHIAKGLYYGSFTREKLLLWYTGLICFLLSVVIAFLGYILPWGQMSFWGTTVIFNLFSVIPFVGDQIVFFFWGGYFIGPNTLKRVYSLHIIVPFFLFFFIGLHLFFLHKSGSSASSNIEPKENIEKVPFYPYYFFKDVLGIYCIFIIFLYICVLYPNLFSHPENLIPANPLETPTHIVPEWYFLPFYAMLRCIPYKTLGIICMFASILIFFFFPLFCNSTYVSSSLFVSIKRFLFFMLCFSFIILGVLGGASITDFSQHLSLIFTIIYFISLFGFFFLSYIEKLWYYVKNHLAYMLTID
jgi:quinol-cytochrome oxidoreductase complex cytochrome b subunit